MSSSLEGYEEMLAIMHELNDGVADQMDKWAEKIALFFLKEVRREIRARKLMKTRNMLWSFQKNDKNNIWEQTKSGDIISLEVGSRVNYALYIEMGYVMRSGRIVYPKPYFTVARRTTEKVFQKMAQNAFDQWVNKKMRGG